QQQPHSHAPLGGATQGGAQQGARHVAVPDIVPHVERTLGRIGQQRARCERITAVRQRDDAGPAGVRLHQRRARSGQPGIQRIVEAPRARQEPSTLLSTVPRRARASRCTCHFHETTPQAFRKLSRSALMVSASVVGMPCGKPLYVFKVLFCSNFADSGPESAYGTIWSSSPCITRTGTVIFFRSAVKSVWAK